MNVAQHNDSQPADLVVIGGGLAGLTTAALAARAGLKTTVLERSSRLGGRGGTTELNDVRLNLGPHALYCGGDAFRIFRELNIPFTGGFPASVGRYFRLDGRLYRAPSGLAGLLSSRLLSWREKFRLLGFFRELPQLDARPFDEVSLELWLTERFGRGNLTALLRTLLRVSTYADDWRRLSAGAALDQLRIALAANVWYLDGGWQTLVDGLRDDATRRGAEIRCSAPARHVRNCAGRVTVDLADGSYIEARAAVVAVEPTAACTLLDVTADETLGRWNESRIPVRAACLDVALRRLPRPDCKVVFDLDRPLYYSLHSHSAKLGPDGTAVLHVAKYLDEYQAQDARMIEAELESSLDALQPGWRNEITARRYLPSMLVAGALPTPDHGGLAGRPQVAVSGRPGIYLAGDWVGSRGMLADASAASAEEAVRLVLQHLSERRTSGHNHREQTYASRIHVAG
ncbi:MAG: FAD-dependent oxidoreductase [Pirellulales bacterium]